jgi:pilus assembly protein CpaB
MMAKAKKSSTSVGVISFMVAAVLFAGLAGVLVSHLLGQRYASEPIRPVVVAARDMPSGAPFEKSALRLAQWPKSSVPRGAFTSIDQVLQAGGVPLIPLVSGEPVLASHLSKQSSGMGVAAKLEQHQRAMAIQVESSVTLAQLIYPGARVDVLTTLRRPGSGFRGVKTKVILQNVSVLAVGSDMDPLSAIRRQAPVVRKKGSIRAIRSVDQDQRAARRVVTLSVTSEQAERLVLASREGKIDLVLRSPSDDEIINTPGTTSGVVLGEPETKDAQQWKGSAPPPVPGAKAEQLTYKSPRKKLKQKQRRRKRTSRTAANDQPPAGPDIYRAQ